MGNGRRPELLAQNRQLAQLDATAHAEAYRNRARRSAMDMRVTERASVA